MSASAAIDGSALPLTPGFPGTASPEPDIDEVSISLYEGRVPEFASRELDRLYGSIYATIDQFAIDGTLGSANTYLVRRNGEITVLLLFHVEGKSISVLNQLISLPAREIERFAATVFEKYSQTDYISLKAVRADLRGFRYPVQRHHCAEDIVAALPGEPGKFLENLGKSTRENIRRSLNRIGRKLPSFRFEVYADREIGDENAMEIYRFHQARMEETQRTLRLDDREFAKIVSLARMRGMMTVATIGGRVRGGLICWRAGERYIMRIIAHDPALNEFKLGLLCCYLTMQECIARGAKSFHFMPGRLPYKYRLLGVEQYFDRIVAYRSLAALPRNAGIAGRMAAGRALHDTKLWVMNADKRKDPVSIAMAGLIACWRHIKAFSRRPKKPFPHPRENGSTARSDNA